MLGHCRSSFLTIVPPTHPLWKDSVSFSSRARPSYPSSIADLCTWLSSSVRHSKRCTWGRSFSPNASGNREPPLQAISKFHYVSSGGHGKHPHLLCHGPLSVDSHRPHIQ